MIRIVHFGLGPIGCAVACQAARREGLEVVGGIDTDAAKVGRDVGEVAGLGYSLGATVSADAAAVLEAARPDVVLLCTSSSLRQVMPQIEAILQAGVPIVSTTEELAYPVGPNRALASRIDELAKKAHAAVLGTGVNPGFAMDTLAITLTGACERVDAIEVERIQDARRRRLPFQRKIGAGLSAAEFARRVRQGSVRHVGLAESITMIADAMGWPLERITDEVRPVLATQPIPGEHMNIETGQVCGLAQDGIGYRAGRPVITLRMVAYLGAPEAYDAVRIHGAPPLAMRLAGGIHGDVATAAMVINSIPKVLAAPPGLRTMRDLPIPSYFGGQEVAGTS